MSAANMSAAGADNLKLTLTWGEDEAGMAAAAVSIPANLPELTGDKWHECIETLPSEPYSDSIYMNEPPLLRQGKTRTKTGGTLL